jgi:hypothetical protein
MMQANESGVTIREYLVEASLLSELQTQEERFSMEQNMPTSA